MILDLIRHGDPNYAEDSLTDLGKREAEALAAYMASSGLTHLYASSLGRAQETAQAVAGATGLPIRTLPWTRELTGVYYEIEPFGRYAPFALPAEVLYAEVPRPRYEGWETQRYLDDPRIAQRVAEMREGSDALLAAHGYAREDVLYRIAPGSRDHIAVVCHGGLGATWLSHLLNLPMVAAWAGLYVACTSVTTLIMEERGGAYAFPRMICMGDLTHTRLAGMADSYRGLPGISARTEPSALPARPKE